MQQAVVPRLKNNKIKPPTRLGIAATAPPKTYTGKFASNKPEKTITQKGSEMRVPKHLAERQEKLV